MVPNVVDRFLAAYPPSDLPSEPGLLWEEPRLMRVEGYREFASRLAGLRLDRGIYTFHDATSGPHALELLKEAFPEAAGEVSPFARDWLGRQFALEVGNKGVRRPTVTLFEIGSGEAFDIPVDFTTFHARELIERRSEALAGDYFDEWAVSNPGSLPLPKDKCVGFRVPLFLGGEDAPENFELTDLDVYWSMSGQLRLGTMNFPQGTAITDVRRAE